MSDIRPYDLLQSMSSQRGTTRPVAKADPDAFESFLGAELGAAEARVAEKKTDGPDMDYLAAEIACRQWLGHTPAAAAETQPYPLQTAYFLRNERRPETSPMRAMRLGGVLKAATMQLRNGLPATGAR